MNPNSVKKNNKLIQDIIENKPNNRDLKINGSGNKLARNNTRLDHIEEKT